MSQTLFRQRAAASLVWANATSAIAKLLYCTCYDMLFAPKNRSLTAARNRGQMGGGEQAVMRYRVRFTLLQWPWKKSQSWISILNNAHCKGRPLVQPPIEQSPTINFQIYHVSHRSQCDHRFQHPFRAWKPSPFLIRPSGGIRRPVSRPINLPWSFLAWPRRNICPEVG